MPANNEVGAKIKGLRELRGVSSCSSPHLRVRIPVFQAERTLTGVLQV